MDTPITRAEHEEFGKRIEDENRRQDKRLGVLEEKVERQGELITEIRELTLSVKSIQEQIKSMSSRVEAMESRDGRKWRKAMEYIMTLIIGLLFGVIASAAGFSV